VSRSCLSYHHLHLAFLPPPQSRLVREPLEVFYRPARLESVEIDKALSSVH